MKKIGILDSGLGGFSVLKEMLEANFDVELFFVSDNDNVPYGGKSQSFMLERLEVLVKILLKKEVQAIVIACNTATVETIAILRSSYSIPFFGIEPYINYLNHSSEQDLSLILTEATFNSVKFKELQIKFDPKNKVKVFPLKRLAIIIEKLYSNSFENVKEEIDSELVPLNLKQGTSLILGCTHYTLIKKYIEQQYKLQTIDPNAFLIKEIQQRLELKVAKKNFSFHYCFSANGIWVDKNIFEFNIFY